MTYAAYIYSFFAVLIIFWQIALIFGAPLGEYTMGGQDKGELPPKKKLLAAISILLVIFYVVSILSQANIVFQNLHNITKYTIWIVLVLNFFTLLGNTITRSKKERNIWLPITFIMFVCILVISLKTT